MGYRLRYLQNELELREGEFAIGRSVECQLSLDDPLVSRRHAVLKLERGDVVVQDLGSRNGVLVNGQKIEGRVQLRAGDKVLIGNQELTLVQLDDDAAARQPPASASRRLKETQPAFDAVTDEYNVTKVGYLAPDVAAELSIVRRLDGFRVLGSVAEKALAMGRADEAERVLSSSLAEVLEASRAGRMVSPQLAEQATRFAAKLATATGNGSWVDYVIEIYGTLQRPAPAIVIDELYGAFRKVSSVDVARVKAYVEALRSLLPSFGPADRFLFQRIEGLERLATLRS